MEKTSDDVTDFWIYKHFKIITPWMTSHKNIYRTVGKTKYNFLTLSTVTFSECMANQLNGHMALDAFDQETLKNITTFYYEEEIVDTYSKSVGEIIENEMDRGNYKPQDYPIGTLLAGIMQEDNWEYLSDSDLKKWAECYGFNTPPLGKWRQRLSDLVMFHQNMMLQELIFHELTTDIRGVKQEANLINHKIGAKRKEGILEGNIPSLTDLPSDYRRITRQEAERFWE